MRARTGSELQGACLLELEEEAGGSVIGLHVAAALLKRWRLTRCVDARGDNVFG